MDINQVQEEVSRLAARIKAPDRMLPAYSLTEGLFVTVDNGEYHYRYRERGGEHMHRATADLDELLYWIFVDVTAAMSMMSEKIYRIGARNRREGYRKQLVMALYLLGKLNQEWRVRRRPYVREQLKNNPY